MLSTTKEQQTEEKRKNNDVLPHLKAGVSQRRHKSVIPQRGLLIKLFQKVCGKDTEANNRGLKAV